MPGGGSPARARRLREPQAAYQALESWVCARAIENGIHFEGSNPAVVLLVGPLQPLEGLIFLAQARVDLGYPIGYDSPSFGQLCQAAQAVLKYSSVTRGFKFLSEGRGEIGVSGQAQRFFLLGEKFPVHCCLHVNILEGPASWSEVRIHFQGLLQLVNGLVVSAAEIE